MAQEDIFYLGVKALLVDPEGQVLLLKLPHYPAAQDPNEDYWDLPGGRVERAEELDAALRREVEEETGLHLEAIGPLVGATRTTFRFELGDAEVGLILFAYIVPLRQRPEVILSSEHSAAWWATPDEAAHALRRLGAEFVDRIRESLNRHPADKN